ncbi:hypothetical protein GGR55DRAFT_295216 [Xylaria sp. FL0064]|nr:hypothetical protein GGR55DRAFT_295216 [Xylaria sp. FL0064]
MAQVQTVLPKGIVLNREDVYAEIAKYDVIPVERILRACHVFSTTSRELYDPTARRLENFWTRMLGGNRRYLSGRVVARLFKDISEETSFVKLRGPDNRYEPPSPSSSASRAHVVQAISTVPELKSKGKPTTPSTKTPRPILKRPRGPSSSGPRPTARFASPPESEREEDSTKRDDNTASTAAKDSGSSTATERNPKPPRTHKSKKKATTFVASTTSRRRPEMPRRSSSQSSSKASDVGSKEGDSSLGSKYDGSQSSVPTIPENPEQQLANTKKGKGTTSMSAKAAGKRPVTQSHVEKKASKAGNTRTSQPEDQFPIAKEDTTQVETRGEQPHSAQQSRKGKGKAAEVTESRPTTSSANPQRSNTQQHPHFESSPLMTRSSSDAGPSGPTSREASRAFVPPSSLMSSTLAKLDTSVIGQGTISGFTDNIPTQGPSIGRSGESGEVPHETPSQAASSSALGRQLTPTQPSSTGTIPLARSKSQLSILLDRKVDKKKGKR